MDSDQTGHSTSVKPASWFAVSSLAIGAFALVTTEFLPVGLLPEIASDLGITHGQAGLMVTLPGLIAALAAPLSIAFAGHIDRRRVLAVLLALLAGSSLMVATAAGLIQLLAGRVLLGIAVGSFWTIAGSLGPRLRPGAEGIRASALILSGISAGTVAGVPAGALLGDWFGWRVAFGVAAMLSAVAIVALFSFLPSIPSEKKAGISKMPVILRKPSSRVGLVAAVLIFVGQFAAYTYVTPFLNEQSGIAGSLLSAVLLANGIAGFLGNLAGGWLSSRSVLASVITTSILLGSSVLLLAITGAHPLPAMLWVVVWGFGFGMVPIAMQSWLFSTAGDQLEDMQAIFVSVAQLALGAGALVGGTIVDHAGVSGAMAFGGIAALGTALLATIVLLRRTTKSSSAATCHGPA
jgi:predicted MFS family arabinose efflux permease